MLGGTCVNVCYRTSKTTPNNAHNYCKIRINRQCVKIPCAVTFMWFLCVSLIYSLVGFGRKRVFFPSSFPSSFERKTRLITRLLSFRHVPTCTRPTIDSMQMADTHSHPFVHIYNVSQQNVAGRSVVAAGGALARPSLLN